MYLDSALTHKNVMFWSALLSQKAIPGMRQSSRSTSLLRYHVLHASTGPLGSDDDAPLPVPRLKELVLIRHGESEGNVARQKSLQGDDSLFYGEFKNRHSSNWRLTDRGRQQALAAGEWLRENNLVRFHRAIRFIRHQTFLDRFILIDILCRNIYVRWKLPLDCNCQMRNGTRRCFFVSGIGARWI